MSLLSPDHATPDRCAPTQTSGDTGIGFRRPGAGLAFSPAVRFDQFATSPQDALVCWMEPEGGAGMSMVAFAALTERAQETITRVFNTPGPSTCDGVQHGQRCQRPVGWGADHERLATMTFFITPAGRALCAGCIRAL